MKQVTEDDIWKAIIASTNVAELQKGEILFSDLHKMAAGVSKKKLYVRLGKLAKSGLIESRKVWVGSPARQQVIYKIKDYKAVKDYLNKLGL